MESDLPASGSRTFQFPANAETQKADAKRLASALKFFYVIFTNDDGRNETPKRHSKIFRRNESLRRRAERDAEKHHASADGLGDDLCVVAALCPHLWRDLPISLQALRAIRFCQRPVTHRHCSKCKRDGLVRCAVLEKVQRKNV